MTHLSLIQRTEVIKENFRLEKFVPSTLFWLYKKAKINYSVAKYSYIAKLRKKERIMKQQKEFSLLVSRLRMQRNLVIYIDETKFNVWQIPKKV